MSVACTASGSLIAPKPLPPPAWEQLAPPRLVTLFKEFGTAALPALEDKVSTRPAGLLEAVLLDGAKRRVQVSPNRKSVERVDDVLHGEMFSAVDSDLDGRPDLLLFRSTMVSLRIEDLNHDGHFERVQREQMLDGGGTEIEEWKDEDGDGSFDRR
ncbi:MAG: hypothetical protein ACT4TC_13480 [Myxococcaceae bacterium]